MTMLSDYRIGASNIVGDSSANVVPNFSINACEKRPSILSGHIRPYR